MLSPSNLSLDEMSVLSGRMAGIQPKPKEEAKKHLRLIEELLKRERNLAEQEARMVRFRREATERNYSYWQTTLLPAFDELRNDKQAVLMWRRHGVPPSMRGQVWLKAIGNEAQVTSRVYNLCLAKAVKRGEELRVHRAHQTAAAAGVGGSNGSERLPSPSDSNNNSFSGMSSERPSFDGDVPNALAAARTRREKDPTFFSPKVSKFESMLQIAIDLPRTIITRTSHSRVRSGDLSTSSTGGSESPRNLYSPTSPEEVLPSPRSRNDLALSAAEHEGMLVWSMCDAVLLERVKNVLQAFVEFRPDVGYVQGMSYIAAMLLMNNTDECESFRMLVNILNRGHFRYFYAVDHRGIDTYLSAFDEVLQVLCPALHRNFAVIGVHPQMYLIDWWMSLFIRVLPADIAARCWDLYLLDEIYLFRISIAILLYFAPQIHEESSLDEVMRCLTKIHRMHLDEHRLFGIVEDDAQCGSIKEMKEIVARKTADLKTNEEISL